DYNFNVGKNGYLFGLHNNQYVYSTDNGNTSLGLFEDDLSWITCDSAGNFIRMPLKCTENKINQVSFDKGATWKDISCNFDRKAYAFSVTAGINGNVIAEDQCERFLTYNKTEDVWLQGETRFGVNVQEYKKISLPDGKIFFNAQNVDYVINETFDETEICNFNVNHNEHVYLKNNKLYIIEPGLMHTSEDYLNINLSLEFNNTNTSKSFPTGNDKLIQQGSYGLRLLDPTNSTTKPLSVIYPIALESSYAGKNIYVLTITSAGQPNKQALIFHNSTDEGNTFITDTIIIKQGNINFQKVIIDHKENIYILLDDKILATFDLGNTWMDITPKDAGLQSVTDISISFDNYIYISTRGLGILRTVLPNSENARFIKVKATRDENFDCVSDTGEVKPVTGVVVSSDGRQRPLDKNGEAYMYYTSDSTTISLIYNRNFSEVCEKDILVKDYHPDSTIIFNVKVYQECSDLQFGLSTPLLRRCFENKYSGYIINNGNETSENGVINITLDSFFIFKSASLEVISYIHPELILKIPDLEVGEKLYFNFTFDLSCDAEIGQEHCIRAFTDADNDCNQILTRKDYKECRRNVGSFDPNDKAIFVDGYKDELYKSKEDKIEYLVRFQNTGTDTAFNVRIEDVISPVFDINTLRPVAASHEFDWEIERGRKLIVFFRDILLVDSFRNEPGSNGFVKFEIKLDSTIQLGDTLENEAAIFFDFNEPVITNKVVTLYDFPDKTKDVIKHTIYAVPNPTNGMVVIKGDFTAQQSCLIRLYDIYGKLISAETGNTSNITVDLGYVRPGFYVIEVKTKEHSYTCKMLKI
ncbi:MAG: T9SS type A sorting domain-containing protein, partial [Saprospiraceae bacterium]|nr:T9SS type A sorting domain-containing protein [Saprospiraceae bacterium]